MKTKAQRNAFQDRERAEFISDLSEEFKAKYKDAIDDIEFIDVDEESDEGVIMPASFGFIKRIKN